MTTFITIFFGGVISALVTLLLGQPLQHYFWRRQRYAERQFAVIEELNRWAAEFEHYLVTQRYSPEVRKDLYKTMTILGGNLRVLFSLRAVQRCQALQAVMGEGLDATDPKPRKQIRQRFQKAHRNAIKALYQDIGIPPRRPWLWLRKRVGQPLLVRWRMRGP